jgi:iron(III) transport system permease protein
MVLVLGLVLIALGVPVLFALLGTFMTLFGFFNIAQPWTLANWRTVLTDELFLRSLHNTLVLAVGTAVATIAVHSLIAYIAVRTRYAGRRVLDFISWLPFTVPGIILGLALLWLFLGWTPEAPRHHGVFIIAGVIAGMPLGGDHERVMARGRAEACASWAFVVGHLPALADGAHLMAVDDHLAGCATSAIRPAGQ